MTQDEIIRMAREASYGDVDSWLDDETIPFLERFAALVADSVIDKTEDFMLIADFQAALQAAVLDEREACMKALEECLDTGDDRGVETAVHWWNKAVKYCLNTVRASLD